MLTFFNCGQLGEKSRRSKFGVDRRSGLTMVAIPYACPGVPPAPNTFYPNERSHRGRPSFRANPRFQRTRYAPQVCLSIHPGRGYRSAQAFSPAPSPEAVPDNAPRKRRGLYHNRPLPGSDPANGARWCEREPTGHSPCGRRAVSDFLSEPCAPFICAASRQ